MAKHQINIGIDARLYGLEHAGLGRYCMNLVDRVINSGNAIHWTLFIHPKQRHNFKPNPNVTLVSTTTRHYSIAEQTTFLRLINRYPLDLLHVPHFNVPIFYHRPFVVTIHDILWHQVRGGSVTTLSPLKYYLKYAGYKMTVNHAVLKAKRIFVPSQFVKTDLTQTFASLKSGNIAVTYEGVDSSPRPSSRTSHPASLNPPYLLYIGSAYPHKNLKVVLRALKTLQNDIPNLKLTIVGSRSVFLDRTKAEVATLKLNDVVTFAGYQTDEAVMRLLTNALCLVHPSKSEGFGLTGLEAMAAGTPVIAANATALPEIYQDASLYFDPDNADMLAARIRELIADPVLRQSLITKGLAHSKRFSWDKMVGETMEGYKEVLGI